jgi:hypothetical protein
MNPLDETICSQGDFNLKKSAKELFTSTIPFIYGRYNDSNDLLLNKTQRGVIELSAEVPLSSMLQNQPPSDPSARLQAQPYVEAESVMKHDDIYSRIVCLIMIPSFMIPTDIIHYFAGSLHEILSMRILRHDVDELQYLGLLLLSSSTGATALIEHYHGKPLSSFDPTLCQLYRIEEVQLPQLAVSMFTANGNHESNRDIENLSLRVSVNVAPSRSASPKSLVDDSQQQLWRFICGYENSIPSPRKRSMSSSSASAAAAAAAAGAASSSSSAGQLHTDSEEDSYCVVCLDRISNSQPKSFTTLCIHTFHIECISKIEGPQCPVCRFQHDSDSDDLCCCSICGWDDKRSAGIEAELSRNSFASELSYRDLWVCLVCGFIGCGLQHQGHIHQHYEENLHTYAMNTDSGRVWDFAGDGYVHRLILSQADASDENTASASASASASAAAVAVTEISPRSLNRTPMKVVEVSSPYFRSEERSHIAPLTAEQEERIVNAKLEATAHHYNQIVHWQLERNRELYETRLHRVREFAAREGQQLQSPPGLGDKASWADCVLYSLEQEQHKIAKLCETASGRLKKLEEEYEVLMQFQQNLEANRLEYQQRLQTARMKLANAEKDYR